MPSRCPRVAVRGRVLNRLAPRERSIPYPCSVQDVMKRMMAAYQVLPRLDDFNTKQRLIVESSRAANMNLAPLWAKYTWNVTQATRDQVAALGLPAINFNVVRFGLHLPSLVMWAHITRASSGCHGN